MALFQHFTILYLAKDMRWCVYGIVKMNVWLKYKAAISNRPAIMRKTTLIVLDAYMLNINFIFYNNIENKHVHKASQSS